MNANLLDQVESLSVSERIELVEAVWNTIPPAVSLEAVPLVTPHEILG